MSNDIIRIFVKYLPFMIFSGILTISARILLALAVNYDCKIRSIKSKTAYTIFTVLFPIITGVVYLCTRNSAQTTAPKLCTSCGETVHPGYKTCPVCNSPALVNYELYNADKLKSSAKVFLIVAICCFVVSYGINQYYTTRMANEINKAYGSDSSGGINDFDDFFEQYGNQGGGNNGNSGNDDGFDNFNNFGN